MNYIPGFSNYLQASVPRYARGGLARYDNEDVMYLDNGDYGSEPYVAPFMPAAEQSYVPGFSNYLEASVPTYAAPAEAAAQYVEPAQSMPTAQPMTQEAAPAAAPYDLSSLAGLDFSGLGGLSGLNFGTDLGGGAMGGIYPSDPNLQYIGAPKSNRGDATGLAPGNTFTMTPDQPVRLVDRNTNTVVFEGTGFDAARKATELGQGITDARGRKANYVIQTANPSGVYTTVANENRNKTFLGEVANVVGTVAPIALSFVPGFQGLSLGLKMAGAAGAGGLGAALKGDNILKGALLGGATAGIANKIGLDKALSGALGNVGGKTAEEVAKKAAADATGDIVVKGLTKLAQSAGGAAANTLLSQGLKGGLSEVTGYKTPAEKFAQQPTSATLQPPVDMYAGVDPIDVLARRAGSGSPFGASFPIPVSAMLSGELNNMQPAQQAKTAEDIEAAKNPMVVTGMESLTPEELLLALGSAGGLAAATAGGGAGGTAAANDIVVTGSESLTPDELLASLGGAPTSLLPDNFFDPVSTDVNKKLGLEEYLRIAGLASGLIGGGGGGGSGSSGTYGGAGGTGRLNPIFSAKLPPAGGLGSIGMNRTARPMGDVDWLTYGTRPELSFFDYAARSNPAPVTTPVPGNPAGPIMAERDPMRFAKGGRSEFAVNGAGTGRSDDIPAVLSDGEYVIDAETVALLGDGSNKAGAKKLDELRVKVRKHKGRKLAKGRFSANAKRPEAYLSGGRI
jgi:hypothetical protein